MLNKPQASQKIDTQSMLSNARIYIRKWIGEGFVGVLDTPAIMFVWDQLFLQVCDTIIGSVESFLTL
mgnify:FL=1